MVWRNASDNFSVPARYGAHTYLDGGHYVRQAAGDVHELQLRNVRMLRGRVVHEQPPRQKPHHADHARDVEHVRPAPSLQYEPAERVRDGHADRTTF